MRALRRLGPFGASVLLSAVAVGIRGTPTPSAIQTSAAIATPTTSDLEALAMTNPADGYALFETEQGPTCAAWAGVTRDGAAEFTRIRQLLSGSCESWYAWISSDRFGDGFVFGDHGLLVTHNQGGSWTRVRGVASVLQVSPVGRALWLVSANCPPTTRTPCGIRIFASTNRGISWKPLKVQPVGAVGRPSGALTDLRQQSHPYLTSAGPVDYLVSKPAMSGANQVFPIFVTSNGGGSWRHGSIVCRGYDGYAYGSIRIVSAPDGILWAACTGEPGNQMQGKEIYVSSDQGREWSLRYRLKLPDYMQPMGLGVLTDIAPLTSTTSLVSLAGDSALTTHDGGRRWSSLQGIGNVTASNDLNQIVVFSDDDIWVGGSSDSNPSITTIWKTSNGGARWQALVPVISSG